MLRGLNPVQFHVKEQVSFMVDGVVWQSYSASDGTGGAAAESAH